MMTRQPVQQARERAERLGSYRQPWSSRRTAHDHLWTVYLSETPHPEAFALAKVAPDAWEVADFIAHAPTDVPALCATIEALAEALRREHELMVEDSPPNPDCETCKLLAAYDGAKP